MARCKIQAQRCSKAEIGDRLIEELIIGTREPRVQEALLGKDDELKLDKAMDIAKKQQGVSARSRETNIDAIRQNQNTQWRKYGLNVQPKARDAGNIINGAMGNKHAELSRDKGPEKQATTSTTT